MIVSFTVGLWALFVVAIIAYNTGNPTAINGIIGAGFGGIVSTITAGIMIWADRT
jgi:high-affinity Fe2+/Pb2+ permease